MSLPTYISNDPEYKYLANQWHPTLNHEITPDNTATGSGKKVWWQCSVHLEHVWEASPLVRTRQKQGCPFCAGKRVLAGYNDLATTRPDLSSEWHPTLNVEFSINEVTASSNKKAWWICPVGEKHVWEAVINSRKQGNKCPYCSNRKVLKGFNDLGSSVEYSHVVKQWHPTLNSSISLEEISVSSNQKVWWKCEEGHEWEAIVGNRTKKGSGCPDCRKVLPTIQLPTVADSKLAKEWHPNNTRSAESVTVGSSYLALWQCSEVPNHTWEAIVSNRARGGGCVICSGQKVLSGFNDLASFPEFKHLVEQWHPDNEVAINEVSKGSDLKAKWLCENGHSWKANVYSRTHHNQGCPECAGRTKQGDKRFTVADYPALTKQWHPHNTLNIDYVSFRSKKDVKWICPKNDQHVWIASPASRSLDGSDCPICAGRTIISGLNDLTSHENFKEIIGQWHPDNKFSPDSVSISSNKIVKWQCNKNINHVWETPVYVRTRKIASGCPSCAMANKSSKGEEELHAVLTLLGFAPQRSVWNIIPGEVDLYIPEKKFAIEFNGLYWHSETIRPDKLYHAKKRQACVLKGIYLYNVWEDDWRDKKEIIIRGLAHRLGVAHKLADVLPDIPAYWYEKVGGRSTKVEIIKTQEAKEFLNLHHVQGSASGKYYLGLKDKENRLRSVLVLSTTVKDGELRIDRYASAGTVSGGFTKLLKYAEKNLPVSSWLTFADLGISDGSLYEDTGFTLDKVLAPDYMYLAKSKRVHKFNYRLARFKKDPQLKYVEDFTERELAILNNLHRIWDFGKNRYVKQVNK